MKITVGISNRHIHLTKEDFEKLFGDISLEKIADLNQPGNYTTNQLVTIQTEKGTIERVRLVGPLRNYTQVEISKTDAYKLGINPPIRTSGDIVDAAHVTLVGPVGQIETNSCILAERHIHITQELKDKYELPNTVSLKIQGQKGGILNNVHLKVTEEAYFEVHLDTDDGNAFLLKNNDEVEIVV